MSDFGFRIAECGMTDRGWKAAPTDLNCFGVLEWWSAGVMEITNHKYQTKNNDQN